MSILFISDLHLELNRPKTTELFLNLLKTKAPHCDALYILGDLFEAWIGDDDHSLLNQTIIAALRELTLSKVPIYYLHGNRDFLINQQFLQQSGCHLLPEPSLINLYGTRTLIMHGDTLCTADTKYLKARTKYRQPFLQKIFLYLPLSTRHLIAKYLRSASKQHTSQIAPIYMDASNAEIAKVMQNYQVDLLIHGHTHCPSIEYFQLNSRRVCRIVLGDWDKKGNVLIYEKDGTCRLISLE